MKKILLVALLFLTVGCDKDSKYQEIMKEYAQTFYNEYQKGQEGLTNPTISIKQLKEANEVVSANFDLEKLKSCSEESYVELIIDNDTLEVKDVKYYLECN